MTTLYFEKISQFNREKEPVSVSIPFGPGKLNAPQFLVIQDGDTILPVQRRPLAHWPDGSIKWLMAHFQPDLPGNRDHTLTFHVADTPVDVAPETPVTVTETEDGLRVDTGPLQFLVPREGFWPVQDVRLNGDAIPDSFGGFRLETDAAAVGTTGPIDLELEESGKIRVVININGKHITQAKKETINLRGRITAYAGKPYIEVEHQFIHAEEVHEFNLKSLKLTYTPQAYGQPQLTLGQGYYRTQIEESVDALSMSLTAETLLYQSNEHYVDSFYGDFWVDWRDNNGGVALSIYQAHQHFPKKLDVTQRGITAWLWPDDVEPAPVLQGMGKTHRILLQFHRPDTALSDISTRSLQFQLPDRPSLSREWYRENNPWLENFFPENVPGRLISFFNKLHDGRPSAMGMFHFGDAPDAGYTDQGRGKGETVWVNNEYDRPHACTLFYALTGQRRVLDSGIVAGRHWLDVDFCHYNPDPLLNGGLRMHDRYHATGKIIPSHQWIEGFLDYYFLTGRREGWDAAVSVAENILRILQQPAFSEAGATSVRENGWALRAMVGMWIGTGEDRWRTEARRIVDLFLGWMDAYDGLLAPYTSHSMPRVVFMISLTVNSLARYLLIEEDERVKQLIVRTMDDLIDHCLGPDGIFYYKELPSLRRYAPTAHALEALTYAYRFTGDQRYLKIAARQFAALSEMDIPGGGGKKYVDASGAVIRGQGGGRIFADKYTSILLFASEAAPLGLLDWYEYPFGDV